jgi:hypothetical protein
MKCFIKELTSTFTALLIIALPVTIVLDYAENFSFAWSVYAKAFVVTFFLSLLFTLIDKATNNTIGRWGL